MTHVTIGLPPRLLLAALLLQAFAVPCAHPQTAAASRINELDSDHDGLTDNFEDALLARFTPTFMVSEGDCSIEPARFTPGAAVPTVLADDGTIYAQAFPRKQHPGEIELHFYHLWRRDCGEMGHRLDTEHVAVLLTGSQLKGSPDDPAAWHALFWYAAAHEDTVCDASQITRAKTIDAEDHGAKVWISTGKHASYLAEDLCTHGCGGDRCPVMKALPRTEPVNIGELDAPMHGAVWMSSKEWPLTTKLGRTDFPDVRLARLERLPDSDIAWVNPGKRPAQAAILGVAAGANGAATGIRSTDTALAIAHNHTGDALDTGAAHTGNALTKSYRNVKRALGTATRKTAKALGATSPSQDTRPPDKTQP